MGKKSRMKQSRKQPQSSQALQRAEIIMKVRCGLMTATEAAKQLGVSRKTYYKWEQRGLEALLDGLEDQPSGRPETAPEQILREQFDREREELKRQNDQLQQKMQLKDLVHQAERLERSKKK